jgi:hypothetical protein
VTIPLRPRREPPTFFFNAFNAQETGAEQVAAWLDVIEEDVLDQLRIIGDDELSVRHTDALSVPLHLPIDLESASLPLSASTKAHTTTLAPDCTCLQHFTL